MRNFDVVGNSDVWLRDRPLFYEGLITVAMKEVSSPMGKAFWRGDSSRPFSECVARTPETLAALSSPVQVSLFSI